MIFLTIFFIVFSSILKYSAKKVHNFLIIKVYNYENKRVLDINKLNLNEGQCNLPFL